MKSRIQMGEFNRLNKKGAKQFQELLVWLKFISTDVKNLSHHHEFPKGGTLRTRVAEQNIGTI